MKKLVLFTLSLMLLTLGTAKAGDFLDYGNAQLALSDIDGFDGGISLVLSGGKKMDHIKPGFSVEGEISKSIQAPEITFFTTTVELDYFTLGGYGAYTHTVNDKWSVKGRAGLVHISLSASAGGFTAAASSTEVAIGFSGLYHYNDQYQIIGEYTMIDNLTHLGVGVSMPLDF